MTRLFVGQPRLHRVCQKASQDLVNSWEDRRMTGIKLSWKIENPPKLMTTNDIGWNIQAPRYQDQYFVQMVQLASRARANKMNRDEILNKAMKDKANIFQSGVLWKDYHQTKICSEGQLTKTFYSTFFDVITLGMENSDKNPVINDEDVETGFMIFTAIVYCPESVLKLYQFLHSLLSTQSPRTIIRATVHTIQSENLEGDTIKKMMNEVYLAMDKVFHFQYGKILLATTSLLELEAMMLKGRPYFTHYSKEIDQCLSGVSCKGLQDILLTLGNLDS